MCYIPSPEGKGDRREAVVEEECGQYPNWRYKSVPPPCFRFVILSVLQSAANLLILMIAGGNHTFVICEAKSKDLRTDFTCKLLNLRRSLAG